jgi:hypothetical protein
VLLRAASSISRPVAPNRHATTIDGKYRTGQIMPQLHYKETCGQPPRRFAASTPACRVESAAVPSAHQRQ